MACQGGDVLLQYGEKRVIRRKKCPTRQSPLARVLEPEARVLASTKLFLRFCFEAIEENEVTFPGGRLLSPNHRLQVCLF